MASFDLLLLSLVVLVVGALVSALTAGSRRVCAWVSFAFAVVGAAAAANAGVTVYLLGPDGSRVLLSVPGFGAKLVLGLDHLSALFVLVTSLTALLTTLFAVRYLDAHPQESPLRFYPILLLFFAGVLGVVGTRDMLFFLVFWEFMTLASYLLVVYERRDAAVLRAGLKYFIITHVATACLIAAVVIVYRHAGQQSFGFDAMHLGVANLGHTAPWLLHVVLALFFVAFATKAGILPMGDWLPDAYPAAPAAATAAFAGSMTELGIYGLVRVFGEFLPVVDTCLAWGAILAAFGTASIVFGTLVSLGQDDAKRLLAFSVIGQLGYVLLGIGLGVYFRPISPALALAAMLAGLFHLVNHVCYKSCLFLNAGAIQYRTGTRDLNQVGGLAATMPVTALTATVAALSISGLPLFSGFSSKWLLYHVSIMGGKVSPFALAFGLVAMFISIATLAVFLKFLASAFFGRPRTPRPEDPSREVPVSMQVPQVVLAALCVLFGVAPMLAVRPIYSAAAAVLTTEYAPSLESVFGDGWAGVALNAGAGLEGAWVPWPLLIAVAATAIVAYALYRAGGAPLRIVPVWHCGEEHTDAETAYPAHSLYQPFKEMLRVRVGRYQTEGIYPRLPRLRAPRVGWLRKMLDFDTWAYYPLIGWGARLVRRFSFTHVGIAQVYVLWMVVGMVAAIAALFALGGRY